MSLERVVLFPHPPIALPEIARERFIEVQKTANAMLEASKDLLTLEPQTVVIVTPHSVMHPTAFAVYLEDSITGDFANFGVPNIKVIVKNNLILLDKIIKTRVASGKNDIVGIKPGTKLDHGTMVPLYYLAKAGFNGKIVVINYCHSGNENHLEFGKSLSNILNDYEEKTILLSSGDLSHRILSSAPAGFHPDGEKFDKLISDSIEAGNYSKIIEMDQKFRQNAGECAYNSLMIAFGALENQAKNNKVYSYEAPFGVGYLVATL